MNTINLKEVIAQAKKELEQERFRQSVEEHKEKLRKRRSFMDLIFPWRILIIRKEKKC